MNPLKPWADFGFPRVLPVPKLFYYPVSADTWGICESIWVVPTVSMCIAVIGNPERWITKGTFIYLTKVVYLELFMRLHSVLVNFVKAMESW